VSKIIVDTVESSGSTVTINDAVTSTGAINAGTNAITAGSITGLTAASITSGTLGGSVVVPDTCLANGHILQVVTAELTTIQSSTTDGWSDITGMPTASITLSDASNKVLVWWLCGGIQGYSGNTPTTRVVRDYPSTDTITTVNDTGGYTSLPRGISISPGYNPTSENCGAQANCFIDNPAVSGTAIVYKMQWWNRNDGGTQTNTINAFYAWDNYVYYGAGVTTLMLMELKA